MSQTINQFVTVSRTAKRAGRLLVIDLYTAVVLEATGKDTMPQSDSNDIRLSAPYHQRIVIKENERFDDLRRHGVNRFFPQQLNALHVRAVTLSRPMTLRDHDINDVLDGARRTYSMWEGYLKHESTRGVRTWREEYGIPTEIIHASGHASAADLKRFAAVLAPRRLMPIHSFETGRFAEVFANVVQQDDGVWWEV